MSRLVGDGVVVELDADELTITINWTVWRGWWCGVEGGARLRHIPPTLDAEVRRVMEGLDPVRRLAALAAWSEWRASEGRFYRPESAVSDSQRGR